MSQVCAKCKESKPVEAFSPSRRGKKGTYCTSCNAAYRRNSQAQKDPFELMMARKMALYGITRKEYNDLLLGQMGRCAICSDFLADALHVDHDEETKKVRGLLCGTCNRGIGLLKHDPDVLLAAAAYLLQSQNLFQLIETETS